MKLSKSARPLVENALCLCSKCNRFLIISKCSLFSTNESSQNISNTNPQTSSTNAENNAQASSNHRNNTLTKIYLYNNRNKFFYIKDFDRLSKKITSFQGISFPLCPSCCTRCIIQIKMQQSYVDKTSKLFNFIPKEISSKIIESSIQQIQNQSTTAHFALLKNIKAHKHKSRADSFIEQKRNLKELYKINDSLFFSSKCPSYPEKKRSYLSLTLISSFWISTDKHYITINNTRIGFYGFQTNSIKENNVGLQFVSHLVWALSKTFCIRFKNFEILPSGVFRTQKNILLYLKIPESTQKISDFNLALDMLFYTAATFFASPEISECCGIPPFEIDVDNHMIATTSYKYGETAQSIEDWSTAMRLLLFNLKLLQVRSSSMFLSNM